MKKLHKIIRRHTTPKDQKVQIFYIYGTAARDHLQGGPLKEALKKYTARLFLLIKANGASVLQHNTAQGYYQGKAEPSYKTTILGTRAAAFATAKALRRAFDQDSVLLIEADPARPGAVLSVQIPEEKEEEARRLSLQGYTITGGRVEVVTEDKRNTEEIELVCASLDARQVETITGGVYWIEEDNKKTQEKRERKDKALKALTGKTQEEREEERAQKREEEERREEERREEERARRINKRRQEARRLIDAIGYDREEAQNTSYKVLEVLS